MSVEVEDVPERSRYVAVLSGAEAGVAVYRIRDEVITFTHTEVNRSYEGRGVGGALARGALDDVRSRGLRVVARCPFIAGWIDRHPDYADLLAISN